MESPKKKNQLDKLKQQRDALNARIQAAEARSRVSERKQDTRRKILIGAYYLDQAEQNPDQWSQLVKIMADYLTRDSDRSLFELSPMTTPPEKVT
jgi:hypothetical protein